MKNDIAIKLISVSKKFQRGHKLLLKEAFLDIFRTQKQDNFWAVNDVSFEIKKGESVGIIGDNGSGKSTLLKLIAGVLTPNKGKIIVNGKVSPLIELGAGFHPELTGRENIYLNGTILGLTKKQIDERFDEIVKFSEIGDFIDTSVKHYSSGMYLRLGFSIAIHVDSEILLIDEILAVGDNAFQKKCLKKMEEFHKNGITIVLISHSLDLVNSFCQRAILINKGKIIKDEIASKAIKDYSRLLRK